MMWLRPSSSIAMDTSIWFTASSRVMGGSIVGKVGCDICLSFLLFWLIAPCAMPFDSASGHGLRVRSPRRTRRTPSWMKRSLFRVVIIILFRGYGCVHPKPRIPVTPRAAGKIRPAPADIYIDSAARVCHNGRNSIFWEQAYMAPAHTRSIAPFLFSGFAFAAFFALETKL